MRTGGTERIEITLFNLGQSDNVFNHSIMTFDGGVLRVRIHKWNCLEQDVVNGSQLRHVTKQQPVHVWDKQQATRSPLSLLCSTQFKSLQPVPPSWLILASIAIAHPFVSIYRLISPHYPLVEGSHGRMHGLSHRRGSGM